MIIQNTKYSRILLKLSGEALMGNKDFGISPEVIARVANEIKEVVVTGVQVALVVGGGNIFRGVSLSAAGMDRANGDCLGMLATVMNAVALGDGLEKAGLSVRVMSALKLEQVAETYIRARALKHLGAGRVTIFAGGTGNPFFTTDTAACLRGIEIGADIIIKATNVDGIFDADPKTNPQAEMYSTLTYDEVLSKNLKVMDATAIALCRDNKMKIRVFNMNKVNALMAIINGEVEGTLVE